MIDVQVLGVKQNLYAWNVRYTLLQRAKLVRNPALDVIGGTWSYNAFGVALESDLSAIMKQSLTEGAEAFANDYLSENSTQTLALQILPLWLWSPTR